MKVNCPLCDKQLRLGEKAQASISQMAPGKVVKLKCAGCGNGIGIGADGKVIGLADKSGEKQAAEVKLGKAVSATGAKTGKAVKPPEPPNLDWLADGVFEDHEVVEEIPLALVLMPQGDARNAVATAIEGIGYRAETAKTPQEAIEKMMFINYSNVVLHSKFEGAGIQTSQFHEFMKGMNMSKRRYIFYTLIGAEFNTLYNLQALAHSANLVVNDNEIKDFNVILRKVIPEYEALFGPLMEELHIQRK